MPRWWCKTHEAFHEGERKEDCVLEFISGRPAKGCFDLPAVVPGGKQDRERDVAELTRGKIGFRLIKGFSLLKRGESEGKG